MERGRRAVGVVISIHALRKESDKSIPDAVQLDIISIHALRKESDYGPMVGAAYASDFNPRSP